MNVASQPSAAATDYTVRPVGRVESDLADRSLAPRQPDEGAPPARIRIDAEYAPAVAGLQPGDRVVILTWLHLADREVLETHPRGDDRLPLAGVFATRSPDRPNPVGLHDAVLTAVQPDLINVDHLEAIDGTPVIDIKPWLPSPPAPR